MTRFIPFLMILHAGPLAAQTAGPKPTQQLTNEAAAADAALFTAFFDRCDTQAPATMITDDFERFHDKGGRTGSSAKQFMESIEQTCARQKTGEDYRARR